MLPGVWKYWKGERTYEEDRQENRRDQEDAGRT